MTPAKDALWARRRERLRAELLDELVPLPLGAPGGEALLGELLYARGPAVHEGRAPRYGSLVFVQDGVPALTSPPGVRLVDLEGVDPAVARRSADGRGSFTVVTAGGIVALAALPEGAGREAELVELQASTGAVVVQRDGDGTVRACTADGVVGWDGAEWIFKPSARRYLPTILRLAPAVDTRVLGGLLDLAVHWLSAGRVGATIVWHVGESPLRGLDRGAAEAPPPLELTARADLPAWLALLGQTDRAAVVDHTGRLVELGVTLVPSRAAEDVVPPVRGTRHTAARRWSRDHPDALVLVVSEDGPVTVFSDGAAVAQVRVDPCQEGTPEDLPSHPDPAGEAVRACPVCQAPLLLDELRFPGWTGGPDRLRCPVCEAGLLVDAYRVAVRGVAKGRVPTHPSPEVAGGDGLLG